MLYASSYEQLCDKLAPPPVASANLESIKEAVANFKGLKGTVGIRRRTVVKTMPSSATPLSPPSRSDLHTVYDTEAVEIIPETNLADSKQSPVDFMPQSSTSDWFLEFAPTSAPSGFTDELAKWIAINSVVGNFFSSTLTLFVPKALPTVTSALGGPLTVVITAITPILLSVLHMAITHCCRSSKDDKAITRGELAKDIQAQLAKASAALQRNRRNQWIGAWLGNAIPDLTVGILAAVGKQALAEKIMAIIQPSLAPLVKAAIGYGIATKLGTKPVNTVSVPVNKLKFL